MHEPHIIAAVTTDHDGALLAETAGRFCKRLGYGLCLVHVVQPVGSGDEPASYLFEARTWGRAAQALTANARTLADESLHEFMERISPDVETVRRVVTHAHVVDALIDEAVQGCARFIMCLASARTYAFMPEGLSTALGLMAHAPLPVLALSRDRVFTPDAEPLRILIADDLRAATGSALRFAAELAPKLRRPHVLHLHVNTESAHHLWEDYAHASRAADLGPDSPPKAAELHARLLREKQKRLLERAAPLVKALEAAGGKYRDKLSSGDVRHELVHWIDSFDPHLVIFGRHASSLKRAFGAGKMSYRAMLGPKVPVVVVPPQGEVTAPAR